MEEVKQKIEFLFQNLDQKQKTLSSSEQKTVETAINLLDTGQARICEKRKDQWFVQEWLKKAILIYFKISPMRKFQAGDLQFFDKIPLKKWDSSSQVRAVPHALVRKGAYVEPKTILMPSYINIGAYVGSGSLVDTWATVGSCAQVGCRVHLSGGVGLGGVLEPPHARPVIIEDEAFIGSRCIIVEGIVVKKRAVIAAGVTLTSSTQIIDVTGSKEKIHKGYVPENSVVIPGSRPKQFASGTYNTPCALIIGKRKQSTDEKTSLNETLREFDICV